MERKAIKIYFLSLLLGSSLLFLISCNSAKTTVTTTKNNTNPTKIPNTLPATTQTTHIFGADFRVVNSNSYQLVLENCSRCGTTRNIQGPFGTYHHRIKPYGPSFQACQNWLSGGYLQLEFSQQTLPTSVKVLIQPKYQSTSLEQWGEQFELTTEAYPINENKGFEIQVLPKQGLRGTFDLTISSSSSTPEDTKLHVTVKYGNQTLLTVPKGLQKYTQRPVATPTYTCQQYTN